MIHITTCTSIKYNQLQYSLTLSQKPSTESNIRLLRKRGTTTSLEIVGTSKLYKTVYLSKGLIWNVCLHTSNPFCCCFTWISHHPTHNILNTKPAFMYLSCRLQIGTSCCCVGNSLRAHTTVGGSNQIMD